MEELNGHIHDVHKNMSLLINMFQIRQLCVR